MSLTSKQFNINKNRSLGLKFNKNITKNDRILRTIFQKPRPDPNIEDFIGGQEKFYENNNNKGKGFNLNIILSHKKYPCTHNFLTKLRF